MTQGFLTKKINDIQHVFSAPRDYVGASSVGSDCLRQIWYQFNGYVGEEVPNKIKRTWEIGKYLESWIIELVKKTGLEIETPSRENNYLEVCDEEYFWFKGHLDALILNPKCILEIKTAKDDSFKKFKTMGLKMWNPQYYAQIQSYMGMSNVDTAYILVLNKDNSEIWDEKVIFDSRLYEYSLKNRAKRIHDSETKPPRISNSPIWFQCKQCKFRRECHEQ